MSEESKGRRDSEQGLRDTIADLDHSIAAISSSEMDLKERLLETQRTRREFEMQRQRVQDQLKRSVANQNRPKYGGTRSASAATSDGATTVQLPPSANRQIEVDFHRAAGQSSGAEPANQIATAQKIEDLRKRRQQSVPAPALRPKGMGSSKCDEQQMKLATQIEQLEKQMVARRGQAKRDFGRVSRKR